MNSRQRHTRLAFVLGIVSLGACGGSSSTVPGGVPATVELADDDVDFVSLQATQQLLATVRDASGKIISATVAWTTDATSVASVTNQGVVTAVGNGTTRVIATAGAVADTADVTVEQVAVTLALTPDTLRLDAVDDTATIGTTVRDAGGSAMGGVVVEFLTQNESVATVDESGLVTAVGNGATRIHAGVFPGTPGLLRSIRVEVGGSLAPAYLVGGYVGTAYDDQIPAANGGDGFSYAVTAGSLPNGLVLHPTTRAITGTPTVPGVHFFEVTADNGELAVSERYAITISGKPDSAFNLWLAYGGGPLPPANARAALTNAVVRWEEIVTDDSGPSITYPPDLFKPDSACSALVDGTLFNSAFIDDVAILLSIEPIDVQGNTLAQAGPCGPSRPQLPVIIQGQMRIDEADVNASASFLEDVIVHEIGHVLGIGTFWQDSTVFFGTDSVRYFGKNAKAEWNALGGPGNVPIQPEVSAHWDEFWFDNEIMTPVAEDPGTPNPLSRITIGVLLDFGWTASLNAADLYALPGCRPACTAPARAPGGDIPLDDVVIEPLFPLPPTAFGPRRN